MLRAPARAAAAALHQLHTSRQALGSCLHPQGQPAPCCPCYASSASPEPSSDKSVDTIGNEKVQKLAQEVMALSVLECSWLSEILRKKLNISRPAVGSMPMMAMPATAAAPAAAPAAAAPKEEPKKEKTEFNIKLESFSADGKIKVIKEVRAVTSLGLKEAKDLVEKAPVVIKANVSKADAATIKKALEDAGGKVTVE